MPKSSKELEKTPVAPPAKRTRISQADIPAVSLHEALRIPQAIVDSYAAKPTAPLRVAQAVEMTPTSGPFRMLTGAAIAYGLTEGAAQGNLISLTQLGLQVCRPTEDGMREAGLRQALLQPRLIGEFLRRYDQSRLPSPAIAANVLIEMGVPADRAPEVFGTILSEAQQVGFIAEVSGKPFVDLAATNAPHDATVIPEEIPDVSKPLEALAGDIKLPSNANAHTSDIPTDTRKRKFVFITHGKNKKFVEPLKQILAFGELEARVAVQEETTSIGVPDKIMSGMRECGAAIIHVDADRVLIDSEGKEHTLLNSNVLIEIGAAMALYGNRFILLVKEGVQMPSNLQGLYRVEYSGDDLGSEATVKLMGAINDMKKR
ncbi:hypothetical protein CK215_14065 [Mesorhizobium sp. WSM3864]|uniref:TIR domain-containing protein n=1 Tax=Mesorhizobium sp. WSM3864 TaxID=2029404 RepID=UPI000BB0866C|nr:TIR domain-containing protein [Mesorhizobium sp. WSM3864]PBB92055.1 hypothetical protein CK215_14065 [Mesorhizobium sp. WSM3864]